MGDLGGNSQDVSHNDNVMVKQLAEDKSWEKNCRIRIQTVTLSIKTVLSIELRKKALSIPGYHDI